VTTKKKKPQPKAQRDRMRRTEVRFGESTGNVRFVDDHNKLVAVIREAPLVTCGCGKTTMLCIALRLPVAQAAEWIYTCLGCQRRLTLSIDAMLGHDYTPVGLTNDRLKENP